MERRVGASEDVLLVVQGNLANSYQLLGRLEESLCMRRDVYSGFLKLNGEEHAHTLTEANNYANSLIALRRFEEARSLLRKTMPVARRVLGESNILALSMRWLYSNSLYKDTSATLDDLREAVETLESVAKSYNRVLGQAHPDTPKVKHALASARDKLARALAPAPPAAGSAEEKS